MNLVKCSRCELNYIAETEKYCKVCLREMKGERPRDEMELCSVCNAAPALPRKDVCLSCHKEMMTGSTTENPEDVAQSIDEKSTMPMNSVSTMDEIIPQLHHEDIPEGEYGEIESELSLERVIEDEQNEDEEEDEQ